MRHVTRIPSIDLNDNPFCVDRRLNEEWHLIQLNRNPSLVNLTPADRRRTASFMKDHEKSRLDFARRKRRLLVSSLRAASASERNMKEPPGMVAEKGDTGVPSHLRCLDADNFFASREIAGRRQDRADIDVDTLADLEPYRREVVMQRPTTFGHRPVSASRMFSPSMTTSSRVSGGSISRCRSDPLRGNFGGRKVELQGISGRHEVKPLKEKGKTHRALGLSASMLKELLSGSSQSRYRTEKDAVRTKRGPSDGLLGRRESSYSYKCRNSVLITDAVNPLERALGVTSASRSSQICMGKVPSSQDAELRRIFSDRPSWDDTPVPLPKTREIRRAISLLSMPDPGERLREKLSKSRKLAAGIPVTASSIQDEDEKKRKSGPDAQRGRWEAPPMTPRTFIARQELRRLAEMRRKRDEVMARRVRRAERSAFYEKISPSEELYQQTLAQGIKSRGLPVT